MTAQPSAERPLVMEARGLVKRYGHVTALDRADFALRAGEILAVIGDNGAGKSTLIKALSGALVPEEGEIRLDGKPVHFRTPMDARSAGIETVYQDLAVAPALSIAENLFLGRELRRPRTCATWGSTSARCVCPWRICRAGSVRGSRSRAARRSRGTW